MDFFPFPQYWKMRLLEWFSHTVFWWILSVTISPSTTVMLKMKSRKSGRYKPLPVSHLILQLSGEKQSFQGLVENCFETPRKWWKESRNFEVWPPQNYLKHQMLFQKQFIRCSCKMGWSSRSHCKTTQRERESVRFFHTIYRIQMMGTKIVHISTAHLLNFFFLDFFDRETWTKSIFCRFCRSLCFRFNDQEFHF